MPQKFNPQNCLSFQAMEIWSLEIKYNYPKVNLVIYALHLYIQSSIVTWAVLQPKKDDPIKSTKFEPYEN